MSPPSAYHFGSEQLHESKTLNAERDDQQDSSLLSSSYNANNQQTRLSRRLSDDSYSLSASSSGFDDDENNQEIELDSSQDQFDDDADQQHNRVRVLDPSEHFRPEADYQDLELHGKQVNEFRRYSENDEDYIQQRVKRTYYAMHKNQTVEFVRGRIDKWTRFDHAHLTIMEALVRLNDLIDESDPDNDLPNIVHAFQTAERIRAVHPDKDWLHLTGLIHDLGKILVLFGEQQWAVVGDTYVVGCAPGPNIVYREHSFDECPDLQDERYNSKFGIYQPNCGLDQVLFSWGHDEYMARVLMNHPQCKLPREAIQIIKLHSFYPWHSAGDYMHLCNEQDLKTLPLIREFNKFDLYTKSSPVPDIEQLMPYYQSLIDKYLPGKLKW